MKIHLTHKQRAALRRAESGQAIILIAFTAIILIGMLGVAIDGGGLFVLYHDAQNAADAAAFAAAYQLCAGGGVTGAQNAALRMASLNGFENSNPNVSVTVSSPPTSGPAAGKAKYVEISLVARKQPYFIHLLYTGDLMVTARAVSNCNTNRGVYDGHVLFATSTVCTNTLRVSLSSSYFEGSFWSNNDVQVNSGGGAGGGTTITGSVNHVGGAKAINSTGGWPHVSIGGSAPSSPENIIQHSQPAEAPLLFDINDYKPGGSKALQAAAEGMYHNLSSGHHNWSTMPKEGLIYVDGDFGASGPGSFEAGPRGLTLVAKGKIQFSGNSVTLRPYMDGLSLFSMEGYNAADPLAGGQCNTHAIQTPSAGTGFTGLIYAPGGNVNVPMSSVSSFHGAIIAYTIGINVANADIRWDGSFLPPAPAEINLAE